MNKTAKIVAGVTFTLANDAALIVACACYGNKISEVIQKRLNNKAESKRMLKEMKDKSKTYSTNPLGNTNLTIDK